MNASATAIATAEKICYLVMGFSGDEFSVEQLHDLLGEQGLKVNSGEIRAFQVKGFLRFTRNARRPEKRPAPCYVTTEKAQELSKDYLERMERLQSYISR